MFDLTKEFEEVRLVYKNKIKAQYRPMVRQPKEAQVILRQHWDESQIELVEEAKLLLLDRDKRLMSIAELAKGGTSSVIIDPKIVFAIALKRRASGIIVAHNHPSGQLKPSDADMRLTRDLQSAGRFLGIQMIDHIIMTRDGYHSMLSNDF
ncbi:MAG: JAB domain-containing protein [Cytophagales bacterium]|nr:JAB domain-containing protein [Cytophagales bacterium]